MNNDEVWNQPAYQYAISQYKTVTKTEATKAVDPAETRDYPWNTAAVGFRRVTMKLDWAVEASPTANTARRCSPRARPMTSSWSSMRPARSSAASGSAPARPSTSVLHSPVAPGAEVPNLSPDFVRALLNVSRM